MNAIILLYCDLIILFHHPQQYDVWGWCGIYLYLMCGDFFVLPITNSKSVKKSAVWPQLNRYVSQKPQYKAFFEEQ